VDDGVVSESREPGDQGSPPRPPAGRRPKPPTTDVFGDVLPDVTSDERMPESRSDLTDSWYEDNRPPHHDRG